MTDLKIYSDEAIKTAQNGPHRTWDSYDMQNEGVRIHALHALVEAEIFNAEEARSILVELAKLSQSYGYGTCDSLLNELGKRTRNDLEDETVMQIRFDDLFENAEEDSYFHDANTSEKILWQAARTQDARNFLKGDHISYDGYNGVLSSTMLAAFARGRDMKALEANREDLVPQNSAARLVL